MERRPGEIIEFLHQHRDNHLQHCDVRAIRFDLEREHVISQGQREQLDNSLTVAAANDLFHQFLHKDPATKTLEAAAKVLKEAPNTTGMNKKFAKDIEDFLSLKVTSSENQTVEGDSSSDSKKGQGNPEKIARFIKEWKLLDRLREGQVSRIAADLRNKEVIDAGEMSSIQTGDPRKDADFLYAILDRDKSVKKLRALAEALLNDKTVENHVQLAITIYKEYFGESSENQTVKGEGSSDSKKGKTVNLIKGVVLDLRKEENKEKGNTQTSSQWLTCIKADQENPSDSCCWSQPLCEDTDAKHSLYLVHPKMHDSRLDCLLLTDPSSVCKVITDSEQHVHEVLNNLPQLSESKGERKPVVLLPKCHVKLVEKIGKYCRACKIECLTDDSDQKEMCKSFLNRSSMPYQLPHSIDQFCQSLKNLMQNPQYEVAVSYSTLKDKCEDFSDEALGILHFLGVVYYSELSVKANSAVFVKPEVLYDALLQAAKKKDKTNVFAFHNKALSNNPEINSDWFKDFLIKLGLAFSLTENECPIPMTFPEESEEGVDTLDPLYISDVDEDGHHVTRNRFWQFVVALRENLIAIERHGKPEDGRSDEEIVKISNYGVSFVKFRYLVSMHIYMYLLSEKGFVKIGVEMRAMQRKDRKQATDEDNLKNICDRCTNILEAVKEANFQCVKFKCNDKDCQGDWCAYVDNDDEETLECDYGKPPTEHDPSARQFCWFRTPPVEQVELKKKNRKIIVNDPPL